MEWNINSWWIYLDKFILNLLKSTKKSTASTTSVFWPQIDPQLCPRVRQMRTRHARHRPYLSRTCLTRAKPHKHHQQVPVRLDAFQGIPLRRPARRLRRPRQHQLETRINRRSSVPIQASVNFIRRSSDLTTSYQVQVASGFSDFIKNDDLSINKQNPIYES